MNAIRMIAAVALLCAGCAPQASSPQATTAARVPDADSGIKQVTLYLQGMNERLQIL